MFLMIADGGGRLGSLRMYIKARRITEQRLTVGTLRVYACEHAKVYRIYIRPQTLPRTAAQHPTHRTLRLVPATVPAAWSYAAGFLLPCFSASLLPSRNQRIRSPCQGRGREGGKQLSPL